MPDLLPRSFYERSSLEVARDLLGMRLVRVESGARMAGIILEAEAYQGEEDQACHARAGLTPRTRVMYGPGGVAYVYFTYGAHWMLNAVAEPEGYPAAVLIRSILPVEGLEQISQHRPLPVNKTSIRRQRREQESADTDPSYISGWTDGPAKLTQAFNIGGKLNGVDLCDPHAEIFIETGHPVPDEEVGVTARIGINNVPEPWRSKPWRVFVRIKAEGQKR